mmetsp:Transcript_12558/g.22459  ORF Transcript_12558/g.22459 Transcript_12558/m.22459 type:complete len:221 (+) Transcript_12558:1472-2134(+)
MNSSLHLPPPINSPDRSFCPRPWRGWTRLKTRVKVKKVKKGMRERKASVAKRKMRTRRMKTKMTKIAKTKGAILRQEMKVIQKTKPRIGIPSKEKPVFSSGTAPLSMPPHPPSTPLSSSTSPRWSPCPPPWSRAPPPIRILDPDSLPSPVRNRNRQYRDAAAAAAAAGGVPRTRRRSSWPSAAFSAASHVRAPVSMSCPPPTILWTQQATAKPSSSALSS